MKVLMLGWEYPPRFSGGLGAACEGLAGGLAGLGVETVFVVPTDGGTTATARARGGPRIVSAQELESERPIGGRTSVGAQGPTGDARYSWLVAGHGASDDVRLRRLFVDSPLTPYLGASGYAHELRRQPGAGSAVYGADLGAEVERYTRAVLGLLERERFDVVHAHDWMSFPAGILAQERAGLPLVCHFHSCEFDRKGWNADDRIRDVEALALERADSVVCVSGYTRDKLIRHYGAVPEKLVVVHNGHTARSHPPRVETPGPPLVLFLGRMTNQKGPDIFLDAACAVVATHPDAKFCLVGDGELFPQLVERSAKLGIARNVHFTGFLEGDELDTMLARTDVFVMPSVSEPFGLVALEAIDAGVPAVLSRQSGVAEVVPIGPRFDYWDTDALVRILCELIDDPERAREVARAQADALAPADWKERAATVLRLYEGLAG